MQKLLRIKNFFQNHIIQCILLFILFIFLAAAFLQTPLLEINEKMPASIDSYLVSWIWSWEVHALTTHPFDLFNANIFAPFENTLAFTENMFGGLLLALPFIIIFNNVILSYNIVLLLSFAISGLGMYLLVFYLTKNKYISLIAAFIYAFAPFKLIQSIGHLHITGMWLPFVFLYLHKFFKRQSWKNILLLTLFIILVFLTGFHYFIFLPIIIAVFLLTAILVKQFRFNKSNIKKIILSLLISTLVILPIIIPYLQVKQDYGQIRLIEDIEDYSPAVIDYFISPFLYNYFYTGSNHIEMAISPGFTVIILLFFAIFVIWYFRHKFLNFDDKKNVFIYILVGLVAFLISFGFFIQLTDCGKGGLIGPYALLYNFIPGFSGIRAAGRYSIFALIAMTVLIGYGLTIWSQKIKDIFKKTLLFFIIFLLLFIESAFVPITNYSKVELASDDQKLYKWIAQQPDDKIFMELPTGNKENPLINYDIQYVFNSRRHFKKIVNGYSGYYPPDYLSLIASINSLGPQKTLPLLKRFEVDYLIFHFDYYQQPELIRNQYDKYFSESHNFKYVNNFGSNYVYEVVY